jgi:predicted ATPase
MIESIEIRNFKSIKKKHFPLKNLSVLMGLNGMGKSSFIQSLLVLRQSAKLDSGRLDLQGRYVNVGTTKDALYQYTKNESLAFDLRFTKSDELKLKFDYKIGADFFTVVPSTDNFLMDDVPLSTLKEESLFNGDFQYLNANRVPPNSVVSKNYTEVVENRNIGNQGEFAAHYIEVFSGEVITIEGLKHPDSIVWDDTVKKDVSNLTLINQVNLWMGHISPGVNIRTTDISSDHIKVEYVFRQPNFVNTNRFKPENVGFGITYGLPVVLALLKAKPGDLLIIENPESHIHPRGQAELGKMIAIAAMNRVQIILETHSDHVLNGIRVAVKDGDIDHDKVIVFYFEKTIASDEQFSKITNVEIDRNGELSDYPKNMLDEWGNQLVKLM